MRPDGRRPDELRPVSFEVDFIRSAKGSVLVTQGGTRVICTASRRGVRPRLDARRGTGWVTAEYWMLPASTSQRKAREASRGRVDGRTVEIQRLIGRALRRIVDTSRARRAHRVGRLRRHRGRRRHALRVHQRRLRGAAPCAGPARRRRGARALPIARLVAAVSVGIVDGEPRARPAVRRGRPRRGRHERGVAGDGRLIEVQGTGGGHAVLARAARRAAGAGGGRDRRDPGPAAATPAPTAGARCSPRRTSARRASCARPRWPVPRRAGLARLGRRPTRTATTFEANALIKARAARARRRRH